MRAESSAPAEPEKMRLDRRIIQMAAADVGSLFVDKLGIFAQEEIDAVAANTKYLYLPGQMFVSTVRSVDSLTPDFPPTKDFMAETGIPFESARRITRAIKVAEGLVQELISLGSSSQMSRQSKIRLYMPLWPLLFSHVPEISVPTALVAQTETFIRFPLSTYHEMIHQLEAIEFSDRVSHRDSESYTNLIADEVVNQSNSPLARYCRRVNNVLRHIDLHCYSSQVAREHYNALAIRMSPDEALEAIVRLYARR